MGARFEPLLNDCRVLFCMIALIVASEQSNSLFAIVHALIGASILAVPLLVCTFLACFLRFCLVVILGMDILSLY